MNERVYLAIDLKSFFRFGGVCGARAGPFEDPFGGGGRQPHGKDHLSGRFPLP